MRLAEHRVPLVPLSTKLPAVGPCIRIVRESARPCKGTHSLPPAGGATDIYGLPRSRFSRSCPPSSQLAAGNPCSRTATVLTSGQKRDRLSQAGNIFPEPLVPQAFGGSKLHLINGVSAEISRKQPVLPLGILRLWGKVRRKEYLDNSAHTTGLSPTGRTAGQAGPTQPTGKFSHQGPLL